jgi:hypothetical protein
LTQIAGAALLVAPSRRLGHNPSDFDPEMVTLLPLHVLEYFLNETMALRESPADGLEEGSVSFSAFGLGSRISTSAGRRRRDGQPEPDEESKRLGSNGQVTLKTFRLAGETIETSCEGGLESISRVGREKRSDRGLNDNRFGEFLTSATFSSWSRRLNSRYTLIRRFTNRLKVQDRQLDP